MSLTATRARNRKGFNTSETLPCWHPPMFCSGGIQDLKKLHTGKFLLGAGSLSVPITPSAREKKAAFLIKKIQSGELSVESVKAIRRDFKKEFEKLGFGA